MRRIAMVVVAFVVALSGLVFTQSAGSTKPPASAGTQKPGVEARLEKMERDATAAFIKQDVEFFAGILADDAVMVAPDGDVQTKAQLLAVFKSGDLAVESSEISDLKVRGFGETAVVTYESIDRVKYKDRDISGRYRWTDVFAYRAGKWQIVAGQGTPINLLPK